jgi:hypothetical protein
MRIWTIHPCYLDTQGLVAAWREGLLAQKVLEGETKGYKNHPQLIRFRRSKNCLMLIGKYLFELYKEAIKRKYKFDKSKIKYYDEEGIEKIKVNSKQIEYEFELLKWKLKKRDENKYISIKDVSGPEINGVFEKIEGNIENWEKPIQEILNQMNNLD